MILKFKHGKTWRYIDNITHAEVFDVAEGQYYDGAKVAIHYVGNGFNETQAVCDEAYLLNDNGKTIEKLYPII